MTRMGRPIRGADQAGTGILTRETFRDGVFARDGHRCVLCTAPAVDAHHITERRLFPDGGYVLANGASLCSECHLKAERTQVSPAEIRAAAGIVQVVLPPGLDAGMEYDKWGNRMREDGMREGGPLFRAEQVQKVLRRAGLLHLFIDV